MSDAGSGGGGGSDGGGGSGSGSNVPPGTMVTVTLVNRPNAPTNFHFITDYQDGSGAYHPAPTPDGDTYTLYIQSTTWSFVWACSTGTASFVTVEQYTVAEKTGVTLEIPAACTDRIAAPVTVSGSVTQTANTESGSFIVSIGGSNATGDSGVSGPSYSVAVPPSTYDLVASYVPTTTGSAGYVVVDRAVLISNTTSIGFDFNSAVATTTAPISSPPSGGECYTALYTANGTAAKITTSCDEVAGLPAALQMSGDVYDELVTALTPQGAHTTERFVTTPASYTYAPSANESISITAGSDSPYAQPIIGIGSYVSAIGYQLVGTQGTLTWHFDIGAGLAGPDPSVTIPDLSGLTGWTTTMGYVAGTAIAFIATAVVSSAGLADFPPLEPGAVGIQRVLASASHVIASP